MDLALLAAAGIAVCYGLATVLQSVGARSTASSQGLDPGRGRPWSSPRR